MALSENLKTLKNYKSIDLWASVDKKTEVNHQYWYQDIKSVNLQDDLPDLNGDKKGIAIVGYACDEGVKRNNGRVGAVNGPQAIRESLASLAIHLDEDKEVYDFGDLMCPDGDMESTQEELGKMISELISNDISPIVLGGGHDIAYGNFKGINTALDDKKVGIINFDAHFDLRPVKDGGNSGTPFNQIAELLAEQENTFNYLPVGIQAHSNTKALFAKAKELGVSPIMHHDLPPFSDSRIREEIEKFVMLNEVIYITIDMDGFSSAFAPGVSAPSPLGIQPNWLFNILETIFKSGKVVSCDIAELNPEYDIDYRTGKLAAQLVNRIADLY